MSASPWCTDCLEKRRDQWQAWLVAKKCPRCPEHRDLVPGTQSCFECGFGVSVENGDDFVGAVFDDPPKHPRLAAKWKGKG